MPSIFFYIVLFVVAVGAVAVAALLVVDAIHFRRRIQEWEQIRNEAADIVRQGNAMLDHVARFLVQTQPGSRQDRLGIEKQEDIPPPHLWEQTNNQQFINLFEQFAQEQIRQGKIDLGALAGQFCITRTQLNRKVKAVSGLTSTDYIVRMRVKMAKDLLRNDSLSVKEVAYRCGIEDVPYFVTMFKKATGMTPGQYRHGGG